MKECALGKKSAHKVGKMDYEQTIKELREKRIAFGVTQEQLAVLAGVGRTYLAKIENGRKTASRGLLEKLSAILARYVPENPLEILFDYVRIRFPTTEYKRIMENVLRLNPRHMLHEDYAFYGYAEQYILGDIAVMMSPEKNKGILLEMKGKGCRQFERYLAAQGRNWFEFFRKAEEAGCIFKRIDLAINDKTGVLDIPELSRKCDAEECVSVFRTFKNYRSGELVKSREQHKTEMGNTLYLGSLKSEVYFCIYEKDYEQFIKYGVPVEDAEVKNRFEIRLKNERAAHAMEDLINHEDAGKTAFSIINRYARFVDREEGKRRSNWKLNARWQQFIGMDERVICLTTKPEPYNFENTLIWLSKQVAPTLKVVMKLDEINETTIIADMVKNAKLTERHEKLLEQQTLSVEELIF